MNSGREARKTINEQHIILRPRSICLLTDAFFVSTFHELSDNHREILNWQAL